MTLVLWRLQLRNARCRCGSILALCYWAILHYYFWYMKMYIIIIETINTNYYTVLNKLLPLLLL